MKTAPKKILRRIAEHILAVNALYAMGGVSDDDNLTVDEIEYIHDHLEKMASKITAGDLNLATVKQIADYWKSKI